MQGLGLWHASTDSKPMFCFSPTCTSACHRMFIPSEGPQHHTVFCSKWFVDPAIAARLSNPHKVEVGPQREDAALFNTPIAAMIKFFERKQSLKAKIASMYDEMKHSILGCIESCKAGKLQELDFLEQELDSFRRLILEGVTLAECKKGKESEEQRKAASIAINSLIHSYKFTVPTFKNMQFFDTTTFFEKTANLKQYIQSFGTSFMKEIEVEGGYQRLQYDDMVNVEIMLLKDRKPERDKDKQREKEKEKEVNSEFLTELVIWQESDYFTERNKRISEVRCPLCTFQFEAGWVYGVGKPKSAYYDVLVKHLLENHLLYLALCFSHRISRNAAKELPISQFIYLMCKYNYDQLDIFDAPNTKNLRFDPNPRCLTMLLAPESMRVDDFEYSYCIANSPEEAAYMIVLLMEQVGVKMGKSIRLFNFKRQYHNLFAAIVSKHNIKCQLEEKYIPQPPLKGVKLEKGK